MLARMSKLRLTFMRMVFLTLGTGFLIVGGVLSFTLGNQQIATASFQIALISMLGAIAYAIAEHSEK
jgi:hypothetical protein